MTNNTTISTTRSVLPMPAFPIEI